MAPNVIKGMSPNGYKRWGILFERLNTTYGTKRISENYLK